MRGSKITGKSTANNYRQVLARALIVPMLISTTDAIAGQLETAFSNATVPYVVLKRGSVECGKPNGEHVAYKQRVLQILGRVPNVDLIVADRMMEREFEREATQYKPTCTDALLARYRQALEGSAEKSIESLTRAVVDQLYKN